MRYKITVLAIIIWIPKESIRKYPVLPNIANLVYNEGFGSVTIGFKYATKLVGYNMLANLWVCTLN